MSTSPAHTQIFANEIADIPSSPRDTNTNKEHKITREKRGWKELFATENKRDLEEIMKNHIILSLSLGSSMRICRPS